LIEAPAVVIGPRDARWLYPVLVDLLERWDLDVPPGLAERVRTIADECAAVCGQTTGDRRNGGDDALMTYAQAAQLIERSPRTVRRWAAQGRISKVRIGGSVRVRRDDVAQLVEEA
jgi:excisionase family DNA binding protein